MRESIIRDDWVCKHYHESQKAYLQACLCNKRNNKSNSVQRREQEEADTQLSIKSFKQTHSLKLNLFAGGEMTGALTPLMQAWWARQAYTCAFRAHQTPPQMTSLWPSWIASALGVFSCCVLTGQDWKE